MTETAEVDAPEARREEGGDWPGGRRNVLIVDDDAHVRESLTELLEAHGYSAASAADGRDALDYLERHAPPDLILLDLKMPHMNGWNFRLQLERSPLLSGIPVVLLSGSRSLEAQALALNVDGHLHKPVDSKRLLAIVERYCPAGEVPRREGTREF